MKTILFIANDMEIGGAEKALLALLEILDKNKFDIDLFLFKHTGPWMEMIPKGIHLLPENTKYASIAVPAKQVLKKGLFDILLGRAIGKYKAKSYNTKHKISSPNSTGIHYSFRYTKKYLPIISKKKYDIAVSFTTPYYIGTERVKADKYIGWIHTDYRLLGGDTAEEFNVWNQYDQLIAVSDEVRNGFLSKFPELSGKTKVIENMLPAETIFRQANAFSVSEEFNGEYINLLSIGRFCYAKNFDNIPAICKKILSSGLPVRWFLVGYGEDEQKIQDAIVKEGMQNNVFILGKKANPYPYIKASDIYVQPSRFEGKSVTVSEAQVLGTPVVITNYPTSRSQLQDGIDGIIVPLDNAGCADGIIKLLNDTEKVKQLAQNCKKRDYSNSSEIEKFYNLIYAYENQNDHMS